ncbi:MAG: hypothetical protein KGK07_09375 [Chloroflexota bacterium]|nr:hypothetical protein [Chloroflexota bacterium]
MITRFALVVAGAVIAALVATQLFAAGDAAAINKATAYIHSLQNPDGGFPAFGASSDAGATIDASFALASAGIDPTTVTNGGKSPVDYLAAQAPAYSGSAPGAAAKLVLGIATLRQDPGSFGGIDPVAVMEADYAPATGKFGSDVFAQALFMLAERSLNHPIPAAAVTYLESLELAGGGWEYSLGWGVDTNSTAMAVRALIGAGVPAADSQITSALAYLHASQSPDGGFPYTAPGASDPGSTGLVVQALVAAGEDVGAGGPWDQGSGKTPLASLLGSQDPVTGALQYCVGAPCADNAYATYQGLPGITGVAFPETFATPTPTSTARAVATASATSTATATPTNTLTATSTATLTSTATATPTATVTAAAAAVSTATPSATASVASPALVATATRTPAPAAALALPARTSSVLGAVRLPSTGAGNRAGEERWPFAALLLAGLTIAGAGIGLRWGGRTS